MVFCFDVTGQDTTTLETRKIKKLREENLETFLVSEIAFLLFSRIVHDSRASKVSTLLCSHFFVLRCGVVHFLVLLCFSIPTFECNF